MVKYFLDSYAIIEYLKGNKNYIKQFKEDLNTSIFNAVEVYYSLLSNHGEKVADEKSLPFFYMTLRIDEKSIKYAMKFRLENKKRNLSYADCIGYMLAKKNNMLFLTGDKEFEGLDGVEFVK
jgi:uncharacterized protein